MELQRKLLVVATLACFIAGAAATRDPPGLNLMARIEAEGGLVECWNALKEIKSCSNEIVLYFMNGSADIGPACCQAVGLVTHHCWPAMLTTLGFTPEECNMLRGYCDAASSSGPAPSPAATPPLAASVVVVV
ncbi:cinnamyl alcohol dehydrogenase 9 [Actinidia rufa]|uniref:Cinnamyl alcohol dehydrogenase 9 n=1 Tax=Actinidia rufa TaxID=165716 RepID=A0A7J0EXL1_9ERIC|nr:cinnamyl alcohol dehydrogenase 9 [Actinidia rufa]